LRLFALNDTTAQHHITGFAAIKDGSLAGGNGALGP
jgi:hypothetical protein